MTRRQRRPKTVARRIERFNHNLLSLLLGKAAVMANVVKGSDAKRSYLPTVHRSRFQLHVSAVGSGAVVRLRSLRLSWWPAHRRQGVFGSSGSQSNVDAPRCWRLNPLRFNRPEFVFG